MFSLSKRSRTVILSLCLLGTIKAWKAMHIFQIEEPTLASFKSKFLGSLLSPLLNFIYILHFILQYRGFCWNITIICPSYLQGNVLNQIGVPHLSHGFMCPLQGWMLWALEVPSFRNADLQKSHVSSQTWTVTLWKPFWEHMTPCNYKMYTCACLCFKETWLDFRGYKK